MKSNWSLAGWSVFVLLTAVTPVMFADEYVADPFRAVDVKWPKHFCKGQDYRLLLYPSFFALEKEFPELANEPYFRDGRWVAECFDEVGRRNHVVGPVAEPRRTRLTLTFKEGFLRFYVDGREYRNPVTGPLKTNVSRQARDNFYSQVVLQFGASHIHPGGFFKGTCESLTFLSKALFQ